MKEIIKIIELNKDKLQGRTINSDEITKLSEHFSKVSFIEDIIMLLSKYPLIGHEFSLTEEEDLSELGVEMEWMSPEEQLEEALSAYPGISAIKDNYLPIAKCLEGSGDPYFIRNDKDTFNVYRIPHDSITNENSIDKNSIELVGNFLVFIEKLSSEK